MDFHLRRLHLNVSVEMIIVDWNPPADRPPLSEVVFKPPSLASMRFITVPPHVHRSLSHIYGRKNGKEEEKKRSEIDCNYVILMCPKR